MKKNSKYFLQSIILLIILSSILIYLHFLLLPKNNMRSVDTKYPYSYCMWKEFYKFGDNELEHINFGSSHCNCSFVPSVINKELKINSYNLSTLGANNKNIYYQVKEVFKHQSPKLITVELFSSLGYCDYGINYFSLSGMKLSINKYYAAVNTLGKEKAASVLIPIMDNKENWQNIKSFNDFPEAFNYDTSLSQLGYLTFTQIIDKDGYDISKITPEHANYKLDYNDINIEMWDYMKKIAELCEQNNTQLIIVCVPFFEQLGYTSSELMSNALYADDFCKEHNVPFINYYNLINEINLTTNDFSDLGHLNVSGAMKVTQYLSKYIHDNYNHLITNSVYENQSEAEQKYFEFIDYLDDIQ